MAHARAHRQPRFAPTTRGLETMRKVYAELYGDGEPMTQAEALALQEQLRIEDEACARRQGELHLVERRGA